MNVIIREFAMCDAAEVNRIALAAFQEYQHEYSDWSRFAEGVVRMSDLSSSGEIVVASVNDHIHGAVAYIGPNKPRDEMFQTKWSIIRSLVVDPSHRNNGIGRALTEECILRAHRD